VETNIKEHAAAVTHTTEITVSSGDRYRVAGTAKEVERSIVDAARGSIMELAWLVDADTGDQIGVNPDCVVMLRGVGAESAPLAVREPARAENTPATA
jgi:hypothetical protein